jgi:2-polyprenyl-3-methyl-5-hydroxy-6-metoxy-1,4-benzoquinol methylase
MNADEIEQMNAHGPYDHGVWNALDTEGEQVTFGSSSLFATRAEVMSDKIVEFLNGTYSPDELAKMTIVDVGCYDGWILSRISERIRFARSIGVEPRQKNIEKGVFARRICGVETSVEFHQGGYDDLEDLFPGETFEIVLCLGMLHHVSSVETVIKKVTAKCSKLFIVDSMIIPPLQSDFDEIAAVINPVDIVYRNREKVWGMAAYKFESPYFDGSTSGADLVNLPQESLIRMCLDNVSFSKIEQLMTEKDFYPEGYQALRGVSEAMLAAFRDENPRSPEERWKQDALEYEALFCIHPPTKAFVRYLQTNFSNDTLADHFTAALGEGAPDEAFRSPTVLNPQEREIASTVPRATHEKVLLELAKYQIGKKNPGPAADLLRLITTTKNADWRSFYRACFLLERLEAAAGNGDRAAHYAELLSISNPLFPAGELEDQCAF